jgi:hypothetical protein
MPLTKSILELKKKSLWTYNPPVSRLEGKQVAINAST